MNIPWEAIVAVSLAVIGFIGWLTKISVLQDVGLDKMRAIEKQLISIDSTYLKKEEYSKDLGRIEQNIGAAHRRIDEINK